MSITIDKEFESLIPPLTAEEFAQLEENCMKEGIRDALITWNGILIDGHNRFRISAKHGLHWKEKQMEFADRDAVKLWIIQNQLGRRNLNSFTRSELAIQGKALIAKKAKDRMTLGKANPEQKSAQGRTNEELGKIAGVSHDTIHKVETILNSDDQKLISDVRKGETTINKAYQILKGTEMKTKSPTQAKKEHLESVQQQHEQFQQSKVVSISDIAKDKENRRTLAREQYQNLISIGKRIEEVCIKMTAGEIDIKAMSKELTPTERIVLLDSIGAWRQLLTNIAQEVIKD